MKPFEHVEKARRLEASLEKIDPSADGEMVVELCMLAGTHYLNAALHAEGISHETQDQSHTNLPPLAYLRAEPGAALRRAMDFLREIEEARPVYVRGPEDCGEKVARACLRAFSEAKAIFLSVVGEAAGRPAWAGAARP